jgi:hypothetical protein
MGFVDVDERVLLLIANLSDGGDPRLQRIYEWLDTNAVNVVWQILKDEYIYIDVLTGSNVLSSSFIHRVITNAKKPNVKALDVILVLHGLAGKLFFDNGAVLSSELKTELKDANLMDRLRLLYSTACYGATHAQDFVDAGFRTVSGALGICTNGPFDFPVQLYNWSRGKTYKSVVIAGNHKIGLLTHDTLAKAFGFEDVNSEKIIKGKKFTRINSMAL